FEQRHRILLYPADGRPPRAVNSPSANFPPNGGLEALAADPARGPDAWLAGGEESGELWSCTLRAPCRSLGPLPKPFEFGLVAVTPLPDGGLAYMIRAWDPPRGSRIALILRNAAGAEVDRLELARPLTTDNFEGFDVLPGKNGGLRFLLASDDNFSTEQRTLLLAFDWTP
ncbi:MAG: esterase-like activity of phytase family protein, partial [Phenylobacterium sp.]